MESVYLSTDGWQCVQKVVSLNIVITAYDRSVYVNPLFHYSVFQNRLKGTDYVAELQI